MNLLSLQNRFNTRLEELAEDEQWYIRRDVARNHNCPVYLLEKLAEDENVYVRLGITVNPNCPQYLKDYVRAKQFITFL